jgi:hypothetical protein
MVYPGGCRSKTGEGSAYSVAVPADPTDKLLKKWDRLHPIINDTDNDPSEAWQTAHGEWRMTGHGGGDGGAPMWATADPTMMTGWYKIGSSPLPTGECQNFFELPPFYPGTTANNAPLPNFVHITSSTYQLGTWVEGTPGVGNNHTGDWNATAGVPFFRVGTDGGNSYAAKVRKRMREKHSMKILDARLFTLDLTFVFLAPVVFSSRGSGTTAALA